MEKPHRETGKPVHQEVQEEETLQTMEESLGPPSHASANFKKALDAVVPACLVLKCASRPIKLRKRHSSQHITLALLVYNALPVADLSSYDFEKHECATDYISQGHPSQVLRYRECRIVLRNRLYR